MEKTFFEDKLFINKVIDKKQLKGLMSDVFNKYGSTKCTYVADSLKTLGFRYATQAGLSLNIEDLRVPGTKKDYLSSSELYIESVEESFARADITSVDRFQYIIDKWSAVSDKVKDEVVDYFVKSDPFNPIYMMAFSGARGNLSQVRQLIGMRGLMADPQGQLIGLPIKSNFREGLTVTEYIISSYGARKGIVDTALRTADSGYLTRRLVDVSQDIIIRSRDCLTKQGILVKKGSNVTLKGRTLLKDISIDGKILLKKNDQIDQIALNLIDKHNIKSFFIRSSITCQLSHSVCQLCYGWNLATRKLIDLGEAVGILAAQSIGEPGTQLTMRTFHTGGTFMGTLSDSVYAFSDGRIKVFGKRSLFRPVKFSEGEWNIKVKRDVDLQLQTLEGRVLSLKIPKNSSLPFSKNNSLVRENQIVSKPPIVESTGSEQVTKRILSDKEGSIAFDNLLIKETKDKNGNISQTVQNKGFVWVCFSSIISLYSSISLQVKEGDFVAKGKCIMKASEKNTFQGFCVKNINDNSADSILLASYGLEKGYVEKRNGDYFLVSIIDRDYRLSFTKKLCFQNRQVIGEYIFKSIFNSQSGRIKLGRDFCENSNKNKISQYGDSISEKQIFLIPEYYFENIDAYGKVFVKAGDFVDEGFELFTGHFAEKSGIVDIIENEEKKLDLILRPGILVENVIEQKLNLSKFNKKIIISSELKTLDLFRDHCFVYVEQLSFEENKEYFLLSKTEVFNIPEEKEVNFQSQYKNNEIKNSFRVFEKFDYLIEDDEFIKDVNNHFFIKGHLVFESIIPKEIFSSILVFKKASTFIFDFYVKVYENFNKPIRRINSRDTIRRQKLFHSKQYIYELSKTFENQVVCSENSYIHSASPNNKLLSLSKKTDYQIFNLKHELDKSFFNSKKFLRRSDRVGQNLYVLAAGKIISHDPQSRNNIIMQRSKPYLIAKNSFLKTKENYLIRKNDLMAFLTYEVAKTEDIIQGLPRVEEILEARPPKNKAIIARIPGFISTVEEKSNFEESNDVSTIVIQNRNNLRDKYLIPSLRKIVKTGDFVNLGDRLTDGQIDMRELLQVTFDFLSDIVGLNNYVASVKSFRRLQLILVNEIQTVYKSQGVDISDKHIEIIVRQMTAKVKIVESGKTTLVPGELVDLEKVRRINAVAKYHGYEISTYFPVLLGITKASLSTDSFISAASFQETARVLTKAAVEGKKDWLKGLKENVIVGRLIPAGTGLVTNRRIQESSNFNSNNSINLNTTDQILDNRIKNKE